MQQKEQLLYNPATGSPFPDFSSAPTAEQFRKDEGAIAWIYNPWTRVKRDPRDIGSDVYGHLIVPPQEEGELSEEELIVRRTMKKCLWKAVWYGSDDKRGYNIFTEAGDHVVHLGLDESAGAAVDALVASHNATIRDANVFNSLKAMMAFSNAMAIIRNSR